MKKKFLVDLVLPTTGMTLTVADYKARLVNLKYTERQAICSLGGISGKSCLIKDGWVTRL